MKNPQRISSLVRGVLSGLVLTASAALPVQAETLGEVSTVFKLIGPNHKIVIEGLCCTTRPADR